MASECAPNSSLNITKPEPSKERRKPKRPLPKTVPDEILNDPILNKNIEESALPKNYNFELHKTVHRIQKCQATRVAMQMPEGLLLFACQIMEILEETCPGVEFVILGNVAYGACCIDDFAAGALDCDLLIHYGHSCLVPITETTRTKNVLYVFVDIKIDAIHFIESVEQNFKIDKTALIPFGLNADEIKNIALCGTIQFATTLQTCAKELEEREIFNKVILPQARPLSKGEVLGCTSPKIADDIDLILFISDGRFHIESVMIQNPKLPIFRYNPYDKKFTREHYAHVDMREARKKVIQEAKNAKHKNWGLLLSTLGRQGNPKIMEKLLEESRKAGIILVPILMAEIQPDKLAKFENISVFVQIGCPRLSIDWGPDTVKKPLLTPYEAMIAMEGIAEPSWIRDQNNIDTSYPMDFYSNDSEGPWTNNHELNRPMRRKPGANKMRPVVNI